MSFVAMRLLAAASRAAAMRPFASHLPGAPRRALSSAAVLHRTFAPALSRPYTAAKPKELFLAFTCTKCGSRTSGLMSKQAYEHGVVIMRCSGCQANHLVADHLGWIKEFEGKKGVTVEDLVRKHQGQDVTRIDLGDVLNFISKEEEGQRRNDAPAEAASAAALPSKE